jgi:D-glycero-alpha-D-manno-heptose-7-phosphate kinase
LLWTTRTPLRVSLFGGGTDYPEYFNRCPGAVVGFAIDKYIHISALRLTAFQDYNYRIAYSRLELVSLLDEIEHPVIRETLREYGITDRLDISVMSDLPASGSGLGSSSAFTVGFLNVIMSMLSRKVTKSDLAKTATYIEREVLRENVGIQDQLHTAYGGMNRFDFEGGRVRITPVQLSGDVLELLSSHMVLIHTGIARRATSTVAEQLEATKAKTIDNDLSHLYDLVGECVEVLERPKSDLLRTLGEMLSESWRVKRGLSRSVSSLDIDDLFARIVMAGAYGAKLCGAGGGGFFFALVPPERQPMLREAVAPRAVIPIDIDVQGTTLVYQALTSQRK